MPIFRAWQEDLTLYRAKRKVMEPQSEPRETPSLGATKQKIQDRLPNWQVRLRTRKGEAERALKQSRAERDLILSESSSGSECSDSDLEGVGDAESISETGQ